jgi:hypothetical protein
MVCLSHVLYYIAMHQVHEKLQGEAAERVRLIQMADGAKQTEFKRHLGHREAMLGETASMEREKRQRCGLALHCYKTAITLL